MKATFLLATALFAFGSMQSPRWTPLTSGVTARLRGVSAVSDRVAWASGANGTIVRTADGGATWRTLQVPGAEKLDFRDIDAVDEATACEHQAGRASASTRRLTPAT